MTAKTYLALPNFDGKPIFHGIKLLDIKEDTFSSRLATFEDKIKIKRQAQRTISPLVKCQKPMPPTSKPKQTWAGQTVKPMSKVREKTTLPPEINDTKKLIALLAKLFNNNWEKNHTSIDQDNVFDTSLDPLYIFVTFLHKSNSLNLGHFVFTSYLDVKKTKIYK